MFMDRLIVDCGFTVFFITWKFECWTQTSNAFFSCELVSRGKVLERFVTLRKEVR